MQKFSVRVTGGVMVEADSPQEALALARQAMRQNGDVYVSFDVRDEFGWIPLESAPKKEKEPA